MMKKVLLIVPLILLAVVASFAISDTEPDSGKRFAMKEVLGAGRLKLGVILTNPGEELKSRYKIEGGALINRVFPDSAAEKAGLKDGDIVIRLDGAAVEDAEEVRRTLREMSDSREMRFEILRDGTPMEIRVTPAKNDFSFDHRGLMNPNHIGLELQELDQDLATYFKVNPDEGVLVTRVEEDGPAAKAGIKSGDVITHFNGKTVNSPRTLREELRSMEENTSADVRVLRHGQVMNIKVTPEKNKMRSFRGMENFNLDMPELERHLREMEPQIEESVREHMKKFNRDDLEKMQKDLRNKLDEKEMKQLKEEILKEVQKDLKKLEDKLKNLEKKD